MARDPDDLTLDRNIGSNSDGVVKDPGGSSLARATPSKVKRCGLLPQRSENSAPISRTLPSMARLDRRTFRLRKPSGGVIFDLPPALSTSIPTRAIVKNKIGISPTGSVRVRRQCGLTP